MTIKLQDIYGLTKTDIIPAGGAVGEALVKQSAADQDVVWGSAGAIKTFDPTAAYAKDDLVVNGGLIYKAKAAVTAGTFDPTQWVQITSEVKKTDATKFVVSGGILGGGLTYVDGTNVTLHPFSCDSDDLTTTLYMSADATVTLAAPTANTMYHIFGVNDGGTIKAMADTNADGSGLPASVTAKRWLGFVYVKADSTINPFKMVGDDIRFSPRLQIGATNSAWTATTPIDITTFVPINHIQYIVYALKPRSGSSVNAYVSFDNTTIHTGYNIGSGGWKQTEFFTVQPIVYWSGDGGVWLDIAIDGLWMIR